MQTPKTAAIRKKISKIEEELKQLLKTGKRQQALNKLRTLRLCRGQIQTYALNISVPNLEQEITNWTEEINKRWPKKDHPGPPKNQSQANGKFSSKQGGTEIIVNNYKILTY